MSNIIDYIDWRGDLSFDTSPVNEVDFLILSELAYLDFGKVIPMVDAKDPRWEHLRLDDAFEQFSRLPYTPAKLSHDPYPLFEAAAGSERFSGIEILAYASALDNVAVVQDAVTVFKIRDLIFVAFQGTDDNLVGWREDFVTLYQDSSTGQLLAVEFVNAVLTKLDTDKTLFFGGHSKGGNVAVYAGAFCDDQVRDRIKNIYSYDGPGFNESVTEKEEYRDILKRVELIIPASSLISLILSNTDERRIVKSTGKGGLAQHNPFTWEVIRDSFVTADTQTDGSLFMDETLSRWIESMDMSEKEHLVNGLFDALESTGAQKIGELPGIWEINKAMLQTMKSADSSAQADVRSALKKFKDTFKEVKREEKAAKKAEKAEKTKKSKKGSGFSIPSQLPF